MGEWDNGEFQGQCHELFTAVSSSLACLKLWEGWDLRLVRYVEANRGQLQNIF